MQKIKELYAKYEEIINYLIIGGLTTVISIGTQFILTFTILTGKGWQLLLATAISWIVSVTFAYITNRIIVFKSHEENIKKEALSFYASRIVTLLMELAIMFIFATLLGFNDKILKIISQFIIIVANYVISKLFVFKKN